jgi:hypothetical protein
MTLLSFDSAMEVSKISGYIDYIGAAHKLKHIKTHGYIIMCSKGLFGDPFFSALAPMASAGASLMTNWGTGSPPGGQGSCLVQYKGASYNGSCDKEFSFGCEEKPLPPGVTTTV